MINLSKFAETLDYLLFEKKMDAKTFAEKIGVKGSTITRYLRCERAPTIEYLIKIADYFECSTDYLLGYESENRSVTFKPCPPFSVQFKKVLKHYGYNCFKLSKELNIHQSEVYDWKNGRAVPMLDSLLRIVDFFNYSVDFILGREA